MPLDQGSFVLPAVETDEVLGRLMGARALLSDPKRWRQGAYCLDDQYCALGALGFRNKSFDRIANSCLRHLIKVLPEHFGIVPAFNDDPTTTHADVLALFDRAIAARRGELS